MDRLPTPHLEKLKAAFENDKLPEGDKPRIERFVRLYDTWVKNLSNVSGSALDRVAAMIELLNGYRNAVDLELIFDSDADFLYRQKGQLKLDNSVIEEFLPYLIHPTIIPELSDRGVSVGPATSFLSVFFTSSLTQPMAGGGLNIRSKDQDFAVSMPLYVRTSHSPAFEDRKSETQQTNLAYVAAECKTNLDKTMFQEACATARDTKLATPGARYFLLCEWLDMTPVSTATTDIDEVLVLRKAKRLNSNVRQKFSASVNRKKMRADYKKFLEEHPFQADVFIRFVDHIRSLLTDKPPEEKEVLQKGYF